MQTIEWLMAGVKFAYNDRKSDEWKKVECSEYLAIMAIVERVSKNIESNLEKADLILCGYLEEILAYLYLFKPNDFIKLMQHLGHEVILGINLEVRRFLHQETRE